jgi:hypothetical protein
MVGIYCSSGGIYYEVVRQSCMRIEISVASVSAKLSFMQA